MKKLLFCFLLICFSPASFAENIVPPNGASSEDVARDMFSCVSAAMKVASEGGEILKGLDKELLQGHSTSGYLYEISLSGPRPIEPRPDGMLAPRESLFNAFSSTKRTDPYVVCLLLSGYRWESSQETGMEMLRRMADTGNARAQDELGLIYYFARFGFTVNNSVAFKLFSAAAESDADAQYHLSVMYSEGSGVLPNDDKILELLKKAADSGHAQAQRLLPQATQLVADRKKEHEAAALKLATVRTAAESGDAEAQCTLGNYFIEGIGVTQDANAAIEWFKKAAQNGDVRAMSNIGVMYDKGRGVPVDYDEAIKWYKMAADKGDARAQYNYGIFLYYGIASEKDKGEGKEWIRRAASQGHEQAQDALQSLR